MVYVQEFRYNNVVEVLGLFLICHQVNYQDTAHLNVKEDCTEDRVLTFSSAFVTKRVADSVRFTSPGGCR